MAFILSFSYSSSVSVDSILIYPPFVYITIHPFPTSLSLFHSSSQQLMSCNIFALNFTFPYLILRDILHEAHVCRAHLFQRLYSLKRFQVDIFLLSSRPTLLSSLVSSLFLSYFLSLHVTKEKHSIHLNYYYFTDCRYGIE